MEEIIVTVELAESNYSAYLEELPGCIATGSTFEELKINIADAIAFHLEGMKEDGEELPLVFQSNYKLLFHFDAESLLSHYSGIFTNAALERMTGINQRQIQRYASGISKPRREQAQKIVTALHHLGSELLAVEV